MTHRWRFAWAWFIGATLAGCIIPKPPHPTPTPTPTPPPVEQGRPGAPIFLELLVRTQSGAFRQNGQPWAMSGAIFCWPTDGTGDVLKIDGQVTPYMWSLFSPEIAQLAKAKGFNALHARIGPTPRSNLCCGMEAIGGPYLEPALAGAPAHRPRLHPLPNEAPPSGWKWQAPPAQPALASAPASWNPAYWEYLHKALREAGKQGLVAELDVLDGWQVKHCQWGDLNCPTNWTQADIHGAMTVPLIPRVKELVDKVVYETCNYGHVVYQISNEADHAGGWSPAWEREMYAEIRAAEKQAGCGVVVHVIGSNTDDLDGPYEYFESHNPQESLSPTNGRPTSVNEYNPHLAPATVAARICEAKVKGAGFWYWRSNGSDQDQDQTLALVAQGCEGPIVGTCPDPKPDRDMLTIKLAFNRQSWDATPIVTRSCEYCRDIGMGEINGTIRCSCPMRNECGPDGELDGYGCQDRLNCEQYVLQGPHPQWTSDGEITYVDANGFRVKSTGSWLRACDWNGEHCTEVVP